METRVLTVRLPDQVAGAAQEGIAALRQGALVGFATETVYGVAAMASLPAAMERLRDLKDRPSRPFSLHIASPSDVKRYVRHIPATAQRLMDRAWPGPVTLLLPVGGALADPSIADLREVLCDGDVLGLRCPDEPVALAMLAGAGGPVVAPSANLAGQPSPRNAQEVLSGLDGKIDLLLDCGPTRYGKDSTIVRFAADGWSIVREGVYDERTIGKLLMRKVLFVCTGNTCRSPLAAGICRKLLAEKMGVTPARLRSLGVEVRSAGIYAADGSPASPESVSAARSMGADIARHRSTKLRSELITDADVVFCMTELHVAEVRRMAPAEAAKIRRLDESADISDPIGGGAGAYRVTAERIERALRNLLDQGTL